MDLRQHHPMAVATPASMDASLVGVCDRLATEHGARTAVCGGSSENGSSATSLTWAELQTLSLAIAGHIAAELTDVDRAVDVVAILAKRSPLWLAATVAVMRSGLPFVWMGAGELPPQSRGAEVQRNIEIAQRLKPRLVLIGDGVPPELMPDSFSASSAESMAPRLLKLASATRPVAFPPPLASCGSQTMCFMLTGGTTGASKCVEISHAMALHEMECYPRVAPMLGTEDRVLQHTAALWAASALGQIDIALAFGATICISTAADQETIAALGATVLGIVPSALAVLEPRTVPSVRCCFTWGEPMPRMVAERWRKERVSVLELLISTEYWLGFVGDGAASSSGRSLYRVLDGLDVAVLPEGAAQPVQTVGAFGELCLRGSMVTPGYFVAEGEQSNGIDDAFVEAADGGAPYFHTRDIVRLVGDGRVSGLEFYGRSDQLVKVAGQFVDLAAAEGQLRDALCLGPGAGPASAEVADEHGAVAVVPQPVGRNSNAETAARAPSSHAFVAMRRHPSGASSQEVVTALNRLRKVVPRGAALHLVDGPLPKHALTGKVNRKALLAGVIGDGPNLPAGPALRERLSTYPLNLLLTTCVGSIDLPLLIKLVLARRRLRAPGAAFWAQSLLHLAGLPYFWLLLLYLPKSTTRSIANNTPFGRLGFICLLHHLARRVRGTKRLGCGLARACLLSGTLTGFVLAWYRKRLLSWWVAFWFAIPDAVHDECGYWMTKAAWRWYVDQLNVAVLDAPATCVAMGDWLLKGILEDLPAACRDLIQKLAKSRRPYQLPAALQQMQQEALPVDPEEIAVMEQALPQPAADGRASAAGRSAAAEEAVRDPEHGNKADEQHAAAAPAESERSPDCPERPLEIAITNSNAEPAGETANAVAPETIVEASERGWSCSDCGCELSSGSNDWRREDGVYWCKPCHKELDNKWWEFQSKDIVDVPPQPDICAQGGISATGEATGQRLAGAPATASTVVGIRLLRLLAPHFRGVEPPSHGSLAGIDSLAVMSLCKSLRLVAPGLALTPQDVFRCSTVGELLAVVENRASETVVAGCQPSASSTSGAVSGVTNERVIWFAPGQYTGTCKWMYGCRGLLDENCFRIAAAQLIARHEGLHSEMSDGMVGMELLRFLKDFANVHQVVWPALEQRLEQPSVPAVVRRCGGVAARGLKRAAGWSLVQSWPRCAGVPITQEFLDERIRVVRCRSWREVDYASQDLRDDYSPPFLIGLFLLEPGSMFGVGESDNPVAGGGADDAPHTWGAPSSFVNFVVSHAFSDGYSGVPLIYDFSALYLKAVMAKHGTSSSSAAFLGANAATAVASEIASAAMMPLAPRATFGVLEERFVAALLGKPSWSHPDQLSLRSTCFDGPQETRWKPWIYTHEVLLEEGSVALLRQSAKKYSAPFDVVLLAVSLIATCRATASVKRNFRRSGGDGNKQGEEQDSGAVPDVMSLPLTLYAPMRDGDNNDAMVGLFSDWRDLVVACGSDATVLGICLDVADAIRHRRWTVFDPIQNSQRILVNILPLDEQERGALRFRQTREHEYGGRRKGAGRKRSGSRYHSRPMRITLEQESPEAWWIALDLNTDHFGTAWCRSFPKQLKQTLEDLHQTPLARIFR